MTDDPSISFLPRAHRCPNCGAVWTATGAADPDDPAQRPAQPGDVTLCIHCAHFMVIGDDGNPRLPNPREADQIADDPDSQDARRRVLAFNEMIRRRQ